MCAISATVATLCAFAIALVLVLVGDTRRVNRAARRDRELARRARVAAERRERLSVMLLARLIGHARERIRGGYQGRRVTLTLPSAHQIAARTSAPRT